MRSLRPETRTLKCAVRLPACVLGAALLLGFFANNPARASDWIYRRSYFSHEIPPEEAEHRSFPESRSAYRRAYVNTGPGFAVRGGYRFNRIYMRDGTSTDLTVIREDWFQVRP